MNKRVTALPSRADLARYDAERQRKRHQKAQTTDGDRFTRAASLTPSTWNEEAQTVEAIASTFADVPRRDGRGPFIERLDPAGLDLASVEGVPLLNGHRAGVVGDVVGIVTAPRIEGGKLLVTLRLSQAEDAAPVVQRVREGTISKFSIGYRVTEWRETTEQGLRVKTAARWRILEVSAVPIPADAGATVRGLPQKDSTMKPEELAALMGVLQRTMTLPDDFATRAAELSLGEVMELAEEEGEEIQPEPKPKKRNAPVIRTTAPQNDDPAVIVRRQSDALIARATGGELPAEARDYAHMSMMDLARDALTRSGTSVRGMSADEVLQRAAHGTSDFGLVVSNAANKIALDAYKAAESPLLPLFRKRTLSNFKESTSIRLGAMGRLEPLTEHGEFKATSRAESGEKMKLATFGRGFDVTRQLLIDDDLGLLNDITSALGQAAAQTEADLFLSVISSNPALSDGTAVFHASRRNLHLTAELSSAGLSEIRENMRVVKDLDGKTVIGAAPKYLVVGPSLETEAEKLLAAIYATTTGDVNAWTGKLQLIVEPRLEGVETFYVLADPARMPSLAYAHLAGAEGVQIQRLVAWNTLGLSFRAFLDVGAAWTDWRGAARADGGPNSTGAP